MNGAFKGDFNFDFLDKLVINGYYKYYIEKKTSDEIEEDLGWISDDIMDEYDDWDYYMDRSNFIPC